MSEQLTNEEIIKWLLEHESLNQAMMSKEEFNSLLEKIKNSSDLHDYIKNNNPLTKEELNRSLLIGAETFGQEDYSTMIGRISDFWDDNRSLLLEQPALNMSLSKLLFTAYEERLETRITQLQEIRQEQKKEASLEFDDMLMEIEEARFKAAMEVIRVQKKEFDEDLIEDNANRYGDAKQQFKPAFLPALIDSETQRMLDLIAQFENCEGLHKEFDNLKKSGTLTSGEMKSFSRANFVMMKNPESDKSRAMIYQREYYDYTRKDPEYTRKHPTDSTTLDVLRKIAVMCCIMNPKEAMTACSKAGNSTIGILHGNNDNSGCKKVWNSLKATLEFDGTNVKVWASEQSDAKVGRSLVLTELLATREQIPAINDKKELKSAAERVNEFAAACAKSTEEVTEQIQAMMEKICNGIGNPLQNLLKFLDHAMDNRANLTNSPTLKPKPKREDTE
tara:strand:+ start:278 stop:1621 length:1344 start_codon:yes stop_codon:yes gene_type:complete